MEHVLQPGQLYRCKQAMGIDLSRWQGQGVLAGGGACERGSEHHLLVPTTVINTFHNFVNCACENILKLNSFPISLNQRNFITSIMLLCLCMMDAVVQHLSTGLGKSNICSSHEGSVPFMAVTIWELFEIRDAQQLYLQHYRLLKFIFVNDCCIYNGIVVILIYCISGVYNLFHYLLVSLKP